MAFIKKEFKNIVVIGGGNGIYNLVSGFNKLPFRVSAIVSSIDNGGSTGIIRQEYNTIAVGDLRRALLALSSLSSEFKKALNFRFNSGFLNGHSLGNILILAAIKNKANINKIFQTKGAVVPVTLHNTNLCARLENNQIIEGETNIDIPKHNPSLRIKEVFLKPKVKANLEAVKLIKRANVIILGPGDLYTSIIPNLLFPEIVRAIRKSPATKIYINNLKNKIGETNNFSPADFLIEIEKYLGRRAIDHVILPNKKLADKENDSNHNPKKLANFIIKTLSNQNPIFVLDFDDTLFNTHRLKTLHSDYKENFDTTKHLDYRTFVFSDAINFLQNVKCRKFVLSHSPKQYLPYQKNKIKKSNLSSYFKKIHITQEPQKTLEMKKIIDKHPFAPIYFIDDKVEPLESVKKQFPNITTIRMRRFNHQKQSRSLLIDFEISSFRKLYSKIPHLLP